MDLSQAYKDLARRLEPRYGHREAGLIANWVMERLTGLGKLERLVRKTEPLSAAMSADYERYTIELVAGRPVQYVLGESWFCGMKFYVDERVLIPRPETEELVEWVISEVSSAPGPTLLDVGTGSGCIAISLARRLPAASVYACDISPDALAVASRNAAALDARVEFRELDFLAGTSWDHLPKPDCLVSNPPYIPYSERGSMAAHVVDNEPALALFVPNEDALVFYRALGKFARQQLPAKGALYAEIHEDLGTAVRETLLAEGAKEVILRKDLQGKDRMVKAVW
ncbi:MAG TPA: peptide chain release factor N(5)-glutamine methyltransferase [Puia sp.]|nr:peptide chain release factor N(5)-glutamine methyltransferase [Puia sp.]